MKSILFVAFSFCSIVCFAQKEAAQNPAFRSAVLPKKVFTAPDLVVTNFIQTGTKSTNADGSINVPVKVVVKNVGLADAVVFKTGVDYTNAAGQTYPVAFNVAGQSSMWYPFTNSVLPAGREVSFEGILVFQALLNGSTLSVKAIADSSSGDEFMPAYCRVNEVSETNNASAAIRIVLR
jgi:hypothetical protein